MLYFGAISQKRDSEVFDSYERKAIEICEIEVYKSDISRKRKRTNPSARDNLRINVFYVIIDSLIAQLKKRNYTYIKLNEKFGFLVQLHNLNSAEIEEKANVLINYYSQDLDHNLIVECQHFGSYLKSIDTIKRSAIDLCKLICSNDYISIYPNLHTALSMFLCMMVSNCSGERSFSALRRIKNYLRTTQGNDRMNALALLYMEAELSREIDYEPIIIEFSHTEAMKVLL